ncbi:MAG TPA: alpha/beta hydrolase [Gaiellaceae bacterium]|jgi:pimeloyl-ACP methyl ester carboxylesterase|nr:alpha/beta hydrolase [Gaiellaceae bacterium]
MSILNTQNIRRLTLTTPIAAALAALAAGAVNAEAKTEAGASAPKPTIVLVHGAWADGSGWNRVIDRLRDDGYPVRAAPNPLRGLNVDSAVVRGFLQSITGPKIVVGHSYGGAVISEAAEGLPDVKGLVYITAFAPDTGESVGQLAAMPVAHPIPELPTVTVNATLPDGTTDTEFYLDPAKFQARFAADVPNDVAADLAATQRGTALATLTDTLTGTPAWKTIPSWYLVARQDMALAPDLARFFAKRAQSHTSESNGSHAVFISHPDAVVKTIEAAATATR